MNKLNKALEELRFGTPRLETPEPESRQGRRNFQTGIQLLDADGYISQRLEACLAHIFSKYCTPRPQAQRRPGGFVSPPEGAYLTSQALDDWARDTNGAPFDEEIKEELLMFMDCTEDGGLTLNGFIQVYQLQTENDEEETWRDLATHGFDRNLKLVATRREEMETESVNGDDMEEDDDMTPPPGPLARGNALTRDNTLTGNDLC